MSVSLITPTDNIPSFSAPSHGLPLVEEEELNKKSALVDFVDLGQTGEDGEEAENVVPLSPNVDASSVEVPSEEVGYSHTPAVRSLMLFQASS